MNSLARTALAAVALPGALLTVVAPAASALEIAPGSNDSITGSHNADALTPAAPELPETDGVLGGQSLAL